MYEGLKLGNARKFFIEKMSTRKNVLKLFQEIRKIEL